VEKKYRVSIIVEKYRTASDNEIVTEHNVSYDDFKTSNRLFVWLVGCINQFQRENEHENEKQAKLFENGKKKDK